MNLHIFNLSHSEIFNKLCFDVIIFIPVPSPGILTGVYVDIASHRPTHYLHGSFLLIHSDET